MILLLQNNPLGRPACHGRHLLFEPLVQHFIEQSVAGPSIQGGVLEIDDPDHDMEMPHFFRAQDGTCFRSYDQGGKATTQAPHPDRPDPLDGRFSSITMGEFVSRRFQGLLSLAAAQEGLLRNRKVDKLHDFQSYPIQIPFPGTEIFR